MTNTDKSLFERYQSVRRQSLKICEPLEIEDYGVQPMECASPPKWHLAHVTWFFEIFILRQYLPGYKLYSAAFDLLFNSYYNSVGEQHPRSKRGLLSRPTLKEILAYRQYVDVQMQTLLGNECSEDLVFRLVLGLNHEQQHQELMFTDLKYNLGNNPLYPAYHDLITENSQTEDQQPVSQLEFDYYSGGVHKVGRSTPSSPVDFAFDNESPLHRVFLQDYELANRLVTNAEFQEFIRDDGYQRPELWLSDAWSLLKNQQQWRHPLYWHEVDGNFSEYSLAGSHPLNLSAPVCHVSGYEADAYARWKGMRLPTEQEWEVATSGQEIGGNFVESGSLHPQPCVRGNKQFFGDVWEWTQSSYCPYPGFEVFAGELGEYNGKFMANQWVLRGGSCVTPQSHIRATYRNFFYPADRWQFSGIRLARDVGQ